MTKAFDKIAAGLADAIAYMEGDTTKGRVAARVLGAIDGTSILKTLVSDELDAGKAS